jgi:hypothetical protein
VPHPALRLFATTLSLGALAGLAALVPTTAAAQRTPAARPTAAAPEREMRIDRLMAPWELDATGVARLSPTERRALDAWLERYTAALRATPGVAGTPRPAATPAATPAAGLDTIRPAPGSRPTPAVRPERPTRIAIGFDPAPQALEVIALYDGGDVIATEDGSLWELYLPDRFNAGAWQVGQSVVVRSNPLPRQQSGAAYDVVLLNGETRSSVAARYAGRQRPTDVPAAGGTGGAGDAPGER